MSAPSSAPHRARIEFLAGKKLVDVYGFRYWHSSRNTYSRYGLAQFKHDIDHGYLACGKAPCKQPASPDETDEKLAAFAEMLEAMHTCFLLQTGDPRGPKDAARRDADSGTTRWRDAERAEDDQLWNLGTFETVDHLPQGKKCYSTKKVYKDKPGINGESGRAKVRLVVRNFKNDLNDEVFAPVCRLETVRMLFSELSAHPDWDMHHIDICNAFCTAPLPRPIYIRPTDSMIQSRPELQNKYLKVVKALYGLACLLYTSDAADE